jgi:DNA-binding transcriptional LysR family regulator
MMNWDDLRLFLGVVEAGSMRAGAKSLKVSHSTISRRFEALEQSVGAPLLERRSDGFALTAAGRELLPIARAMAVQADTFGRRAKAFDHGMGGLLRITMPEVVASHLLARHLFDFMTMHPSLRVEVLGSIRPFDLTKREADLAVRFTHRPPEHLVGHRIGMVYQAAYCLPAYRAQYTPDAADSTARWIGFGDDTQQALWISRSAYPHLRSAGRFDDMPLQVEAARAGQGIALLPCFIGDRVDAFERISDPQPMADLWLLFHPDLRSAEKIKALRAHLLERRAEITRELEGRALRRL